MATSTNKQFQKCTFRGDFNKPYINYNLVIQKASKLAHILLGSHLIQK